MVSTTRTLRASPEQVWEVLADSWLYPLWVEDAMAAPGRLVPPPVRGLTLRWRNVEALRRLAYVGERRTA